MYFVFFPPCVLIPALVHSASRFCVSLLCAVHIRFVFCPHHPHPTYLHPDMHTASSICCSGQKLRYILTPPPARQPSPAQTIITVVAHLCARLLESSAEIRSTILVQRVYRSFLERTGRGDLVARARAAKAKARAKAAAARAAMMIQSGGQVPPFTPPTMRRGSAVGVAGAGVPPLPPPEQAVFVSEKQQARLAAVTIQRWWAAGAEERLKKLGRSMAATAVQAAWRGRAAREVVRAERAERTERAQRETERRMSEV